MSLFKNSKMVFIPKEAVEINKWLTNDDIEKYFFIDTENDKLKK